MMNITPNDRLEIGFTADFSDEHRQRVATPCCAAPAPACFRRIYQKPCCNRGEAWTTPARTTGSSPRPRISRIPRGRTRSPARPRTGNTSTTTESSGPPARSTTTRAVSSAAVSSSQSSTRAASSRNSTRTTSSGRPTSRRSCTWPWGSRNSCRSRAAYAPRTRTRSYVRPHGLPHRAGPVVLRPEPHGLEGVVRLPVHG